MKLSVLKIMKKQKILYAITAEDVINISEQENIPFTEKDLYFIEDKIGDFLGSQWHDAIVYALKELERVNSLYDIRRGA